MISDRLPDMLLCTSGRTVTFSQIMKREKHADAKVKLFQWVENALSRLSLLRMKVWKAEQKRREPRKC